MSGVLVSLKKKTPVESTLMPVSLPVVKPFWLLAVTSKLSPCCVVLLILNTMFIWAAAVAGVYAGKVMLPLAGAVSPFFFSSRRRHTRYWRDWSSDVCSSDLLVYGDLNDASSLNRILRTVKP